MSPKELAKDNPLKGKPRISTLAELSTEDIQELEVCVSRKITYDAEDAECNARFDVIKQNTQCIFAKKSRAWGSDLWNDELTLEDNITRYVLKSTEDCILLTVTFHSCFRFVEAMSVQFNSGHT